MVKWIVVMKIQPSICLDDWGKPRKTPVRLIGIGIRTRDLPNASLVRYHGATSLGDINLVFLQKKKKAETSLNRVNDFKNIKKNEESWRQSGSQDNNDELTYRTSN